MVYSTSRVAGIHTHVSAYKLFVPMYHTASNLGQSPDAASNPYWCTCATVKTPASYTV